MKQQQQKKAAAGGGKRREQRQHGPGAGAAAAGDIGRAEQPLQAVVLADSFTRTLRPVTVEMPKVLVPLANVPLLEYTLEFLAAAGVEEVIVFCCWRARDVEEYLGRSKWARTARPRVKTVSFQRAGNAGDALRELEAMNIVRSDPFILMHGDVVANLNLIPALEAHKARRAKDKNAVMTMIFRSCEKTTNEHYPRIKTLEEDIVVATKATTGQILRYENDSDSRNILFNEARSLFQSEGPSLEVRYDLCDTYIDICSPEVLLQISDNYDYQDLRKDFVRLEVQNLELGYKIYSHVFSSPTDYAVRVHDLRIYDAVSKDVMNRWTYPRVPDTNWSSTVTTYWMSRGFIYQEADVQLARTAVIKENVVIGSKTKIGNNVILKNCTIGRNCVIGDNVTISDSYLWDNVTVGNNVSINHSLICNEAKIRNNCIIPRGSVISFKVVVGESVKLKPFSRLTRIPKMREDDDNWSQGEGSEDNNENKEEIQQDASNRPAKRSLYKRMESQDSSAPGFENINNANIVDEFDVVGKDGFGRIYDPKAEDSQNEEEDEDDDDDDEEDDYIPNETDAPDRQKEKEFSFAPDWAKPVLRNLYKSNLVSNTTSYFVLKNSMGMSELENARSTLWSDELLHRFAGTMMDSGTLNNSFVNHHNDDIDDYNHITKKTTTFKIEPKKTVSTSSSSSNTSQQGALGGHVPIQKSQSRMIQTNSVNEKFLKGVKEFVKEAKDLENFHLEVGMYKSAENKTYADIIYAMIPVILFPCVQLLRSNDKPHTTKHLVNEMNENLNKYAPYISKFLLSVMEQHALIEACELFCLYGEYAGFVGLGDQPLKEFQADPVLRSMFPFILKSLTDKDMLSKESLQRWIDSHHAADKSIIDMKSTKEILSVLLADSSSEEEEDDDEEDDDE